MTFEISTE